MVRLLILAFALLSATPALAGQALAYGPEIKFAAFRNGEQIGSHRLTFERDGDRLVVTTSIDLAVKMIGVTLYRYTHRSREIWIGEELNAFDSQTDDNGDPYTVRARRNALELDVEKKAPGSAGPTQTVMPADLLPSTHWNAKQTAQGFLLNAQKGTKDEITVTPQGRESVKTLSGFVAATLYRYGGGVRMDQWFDDRGRWVKSRFVVSDGSTVEYLLQE
jgi:hypothetical protein